MVTATSEAPTRAIEGLSRIAADYDALFCDVWGVVHNGVAAFPDALDAMRRFRAGGGVVMLVSNAPRPYGAVLPQLKALGAGDDAYDAVTTSGDVARALIADRADQPAHHIGPDRDLSLFEGLAARRVPIEEATYLICTGLLDDERETALDYAATLRRALVRDLTLICANPDLVVDRGGRLIPCAGAIGALYESLGGRVVWCGKPYAPVYELAGARLGQIAGRPIAAERILCVGDALRTDVAGGAARGHATLFIGDGIHAHEIGGGGPSDAAALTAFAASGAAPADFAATRLRW